MSSVESFDNFELFSQYNPLMRNYGNPVMNMLMMQLFGQNYMPTSDNGQSMYYSELQKQRSFEMMQSGFQGFADNPIFKRLGIGSGTSIGSTLSHMFGSPDSAVARGMSPFIGGNPAAASMQLYAGLSGSNIMGAFNRGDEGVSVAEVGEIMQSLAGNFYKQQQYGGPLGAKEEADKRIRERIATEVRRGDKGIEALKQVGIEVPEKLKENFFDEKGNPTKQAQRFLKGYSITAAEEGEKETEEAKKVSSSITTKRRRMGELELGVEDIVKKSAEKTQEEINKDIEKLIEEQYGDAAEEVKKRSKTKSGKYDTSKLLKDAREKDFALNYFEKERVASERDKEQGQKIVGFNFENSRGFKVEDFTSAFVKAADLRMLGNAKGKTASESMRDFSENAGGALSAARSLFGANKSGGQLVSSINEMLGTSAADLGSAEGSEEIEKLLRRVKATANVAGVSIKSLLGIISATKQLARNSPQLQYLNDTASTELATKAVRVAASAAAGMSSAEYRAAGGSEKMATERIQATTEYIQSEQGTSYTSWLAAAKQKGPGAYAAMKSYLTAIPSGEQADPAKVGQILGTSGADATQLASNKTLAQAALKDQEISKDISGMAQKNTATEIFRLSERRNLSKQEIYSTIAEARKNKQDPRLALHVLFGRHFNTQESATLMNKYGVQLMDQYDEDTRTPEEKQRIEQRTKRRAAEDQKMAKQYDRTQAHLFTQITDAVARGKDTDEVIGNLTHIFAVDRTKSTENQTASEKALNSSKRLLTNFGDEKITDTELIKAGAGEDMSNILKLERQEAKEKLQASGGRDKKAAQRLEELGEGNKLDLSGEEISSAAKTLRKYKYSAKEARQKFRSLEGTDPSKLSTEEKELKRALSVARQGNLFQSDASMEAVNKTGDIRGFFSGVMTARGERGREEEREAKKEAVYSRFNEDASGLQDSQSKQTIESLRQNFTDETGKLDIKKALAAYSDPYKKSDVFYTTASDGMGGTKRELKSEFADSPVGRALREAEESLRAASKPQPGEEGAEQGKPSELQAMEKMTSGLKELTDEIKNGGGIGKALEDLIKKLTDLKLH